MGYDIIRGVGTPLSFARGLGGDDLGFAERRIRVYDEPDASQLEVVPPQNLFKPGSRLRVERKTLTAYLQMWEASRRAGFKGKILAIVSGFRGNASQKVLWERALRKYGTPEKARVWVAPPGSSPHVTGRAIDLWLGAACDSRNVAALRKTKIYAWLVANGEKYGFYPYMAEPWHWEHNPPSGPEIEESPPPRRPSQQPQVFSEERQPAKKGSSALPIIVGVTLAVGAGALVLGRRG